MTPVRSICPYCGVGCGVLVNVRRGRVESVRGDPEHPTNRGGLCAKGQRLAEVVRAEGRLTRPLLRPRSGSGFDRAQAPVPVSWAKAIEAVAGGIRQAVAEGGPGAVALYLSGQLLTEDYYVANKLAKGLLGTANVDTNSRLCMASTAAAYKRSFGADGPPGCYEDLEAAADVIFWGSNAADTHPILFGRLQQARAQGAQRWTVTDPRRTATAAAADRHLALRPGSDVALALGLAATLFQEGLVDEAAVRRSCEGLDALRESALAMPAELAAPICGIEAAEIRALAREFAASPAALSLWCQGLNQSSSGTDKVTAVLNLHLLAGQIGRPGAGPFSLTGQANAMGGREVGGMATELAAHHRLDDPADREAVESFWELGPVPAGRGVTAVELIEAIEEPRVRVLWVICSNPLASLPDGWAARRAFAKLDLLVVQDLHHPTDTGALADVLLPAAGWAEKTGTLTSSERRVALTEAAVEPPGEARPDWEILAEVGRALAGGSAFRWADAAAVFAEHVDLTRGRDLDMSGLSHRLLRVEGPQQWPYPAGGGPQARRYLDGRYATADGKARLVPIAYRPPAEEVGAGHPLRLTTGRDRDQWHTMTRTGRVAALRAEAGTTVVALSPEDAAGAGLAEGATAVVSSERGSLRARVRIDAGQPPGLAFIPFHRGPLLEPDGWCNGLTSRALDPISFQPELKHTVVRIGPAPAGVAIGGGVLARAVRDRLEAEGVPARLLDERELEAAPEGMLRVLITGELEAGLAWWELAGASEGLPHPPERGLALIDLGAGPEPLAALPALRAAGWQVRRRGGGGLPELILARLERAIPEAGPGEEAGLLVGRLEVGAGNRERGEGMLVLTPGGSLSGANPLSGDPSTLAAHLAGRIPRRAALRRLVVPIGKLALVVAGEPLGEGDLLVHQDGAAGSAQHWRVSSGEVLGVAAVVERPVADDIERLWLADVEPALLRARLPLR